MGVPSRRSKEQGNRSGWGNHQERHKRVVGPPRTVALPIGIVSVTPLAAWDKQQEGYSKESVSKRAERNAPIGIPLGMSAWKGDKGWVWETVWFSTYGWDQPFPTGSTTSGFCASAYFRCTLPQGLGAGGDRKSRFQGACPLAGCSARALRTGWNEPVANAASSVPTSARGVRHGERSEGQRRAGRRNGQR